MSHVAILDRSVLRVQCPADEFRRRVGTWVLRFEGVPPELPVIPGLLGVSSFPGEVRVNVAGDLDEADSRLRTLNDVQIERLDIGMQDAVASFMDERGSRRSLLQSIGAGE
ncbi:MAG: hypothetical protein ACKVHE_30105 [Planctomycetales bacterium]